MKNKIFWKAHPGPQEEALRRAEFETLYGGSRGGGKTDAGQVWLIEPEYIQHPRYRFLVIRKNAKDLSDWIDRARVMYKPLKAQIVGNPSEIRFPNGAIGRTGHLKDAGAYEQYIGHEYHKILIEELTLIAEEEQYLKLISSARSTVKGLDPKVFCTTNPGNDGHGWVKKRFIDPGIIEPKKYHFGNFNPFQDPKTGKWRIYIPSRVTDNPTLMNNDPSYYQWLLGLPEKLRSAWLEGSWDIFIGHFFTEWDEHYHVYEPFPIPKGWPRFRAMDWGYSDHFCCLWFAVGPDNHVYIYREFYKNRMTDSEYAENVFSLSVYPDGSPEHIEYTVGDPNSFWVKNPDTGIPRFETYAHNGIPIIKADNSHLSGWSRVREYLKLREYQGRLSPWVHISRDCSNLIRTLPMLVHDKIKVEDILDGMEDDAPVTLRYGLQSRAPIFTPARPKYRNNYEAALAQAEREERLAQLY